MSHLSPVTPGQSGAGTEPSRFLLGKTLAVYHRAHIGVVVHAPYGDDDALVQGETVRKYLAEAVCELIGFDDVGHVLSFP